MANEKQICNQICRWNDSSDGCVKPNGRICPMSNTEPDTSGWGQVKANEKRLIDARFLTSQMYMICEVCQTENIFIDAIIDEIDNAPDVDAVEVVRCKDCRNYDDEGYCWFWKYETGMSPNEVYADDFCSYGERKDND